jgi:heme oxygenase
MIVHFQNNKIVSERIGILDRLREETSELHKKIEKALPVMRPGFQLPEYRLLVARFYGFYLPVERDLDRLRCLEEALPDWRKRRKTEWLHKDLLALGCTAREIAGLPFCDDVPATRAVPESLGCLYVLEGSTLGGQIISRHLQAALGLGPDNGGAFFRGYDLDSGPMWKVFRTAVPLAVTIEEHDRTVSAAKETFHCLHAWLK